MDIIHSVEKLVGHTGKIKWLSLHNDESLLLSTAEDSIIVWDLTLRTHQVITKAPNINRPAFWTPLREDVLTKDFVCAMGSGSLHVFSRRWSENIFNDVLDLDDKEAKHRIFNYLFYFDQQRRRYGYFGHAPTNESFPEVHVNWAGGCMCIKAAPEPGVIEIHRWVEHFRPIVGDRGIQLPNQNDGKGDTEPPCQNQAFNTAEQSPGYGRFLLICLCSCFLYATCSCSSRHLIFIITITLSLYQLYFSS